MLHLPIETITEAQLGDLIQAKAAESLHIEYKRQTYGGGDGAHREFLADVSSFANARGGDLLNRCRGGQRCPFGSIGVRWQR